MSFEIPGHRITLVAAADLSASQHKAIAVDINGKAAIAGAGVKIAGLLRNDPNIGEEATIVTNNVAIGVAGAGGVAAGAELEVGAAGALITLAAGKPAGIALAAAAAGEKVAVLLR